MNKVNLKNIIKWRNHIHEYPEVSFNEYNTSNYIVKILETFDGLEISRPTKTSVIATLDTGFIGPSIAFRADIDALAMQEEACVDYKSKIDGIMHGCGHDTHAAMLLGAIEVICQLVKEDKLKGKMLFIFQHAEEVPPGGAVELVHSGILNGVDEIYGMHIGGGFEVGEVPLFVGNLTSASDTFTLKLQGKGSHASTPEKAIDLVTVGAQIVNALQTITSRNVSAFDQVVLTVATFNIGTAPNVIAHDGILSGTIRTFNKDTRELVKRRMEAIISGITQANDIVYDLSFIKGYDCVHNSQEQVDVLERATNATDKAFIIQGEPMMGSEDFSAYTNVIPGAYAFLGGGGKYFNHHPKFEIEDEALEIGSTIFVNIVLDRLSK